MTTPKLSPTGAIAISADIDGVDAAALAMERKWGVGRLRLLVGFELRERFDRQRAKFSSAVWSGDIAGARRHAEAMVRAWRALDQAAEAAGHKPLSPQVWEAVTEKGEVVAIARTPEDAHAYDAGGRTVHLFMLSEVVKLLEAYPEVKLAKQTFPGCVVEQVRTRDDALVDVLELDDAIPL